MLPMAVARSSSGGAVIGYVLPVLSLTTCLHNGQDIGDAKRTIGAYSKTCSTDLISWRILKLTRQEAAPVRNDCLFASLSCFNRAVSQ